MRINPTNGLGFTHRSKPRNRVLSDAELGKLWNGISGAPGISDEMRIVLKLAVLTGQRRESEIAGAVAKELRLTESNPTWRIPSERMKRKNREQIVPLSTQAATLFEQALSMNLGSAYVFPAHTLTPQSRKPHINGESVSRAMARLREKIGLKDARVHDLRKCVVTWLREHQGVSGDVCDLILHHARGGVTASHYDFATLQGPVRKALQSWSDHIEAVAAGQKAPKANVVTLARA